MSSNFQVHWLAITVWAAEKDLRKAWSKLLEPDLGPLEDLQYGIRGFARSSEALAGARIGWDPRPEPEQNFAHIVLPGRACEALGATKIRRLLMGFQSLGKIRFTRIDLAFDGVGFSPDEFYQEIAAGNARTLAKRRTLRMVKSEFEARDDGEEGCSTAYLGSSSSERYLRVYDKRGPTRVELVLKGDRATAVGEKLLQLQVQSWGDEAVGHLRDYVDVIADWWEDFIGEIARAYLVLEGRRVELGEEEYQRVKQWLERSVATSLAMIAAIEPELAEELAARGRARMSKRHKWIVQSVIDRRGVVL